ncbi:hypothetical protein H6771_02190 [Candidatus Peribacteria bacterium]|nr:hypothetical protein [Candidatus Peribacteria bacterium]
MEFSQVILDAEDRARVVVAAAHEAAQDRIAAVQTAVQRERDIAEASHAEAYDAALEALRVEQKETELRAEKTARAAAEERYRMDAKRLSAVLDSLFATIK